MTQLGMGAFAGRRPSRRPRPACGRAAFPGTCARPGRPWPRRCRDADRASGSRCSPGRASPRRASADSRHTPCRASACWALAARPSLVVVGHGHQLDARQIVPDQVQAVAVVAVTGAADDRCSQVFHGCRALRGRSSRACRPVSPRMCGHAQLRRQCKSIGGAQATSAASGTLELRRRFARSSTSS